MIVLLVEARSEFSVHSGIVAGHEPLHSGKPGGHVFWLSPPQPPPVPLEDRVVRPVAVTRTHNLTGGSIT